MNKIIVLGNGYIGKQVYKHLVDTIIDSDVNYSIVISIIIQNL